MKERLPKQGCHTDQWRLSQKLWEPGTFKGLEKMRERRHLRILSPLKPFFQHESKIKTFSGKQKPRPSLTGVLKNKPPEQRKRSPAGILRCQKKNSERGEKVGKFKQTLKI